MPNIDELMAQMPNPNSVGAPGMQGPPPMGSQAPDMSAGASSPEMASPDQIGELKSLFQGVQNQNAQVSGKEIINRNQISLMRKDVLTKLFEILQQAGVDPGDPQSVRAFFLEQLESQDPDLMEIFVTAFNDMQGGTPGESPDEESTEGESPNMLDRFQTLSRMGQQEPGGDETMQQMQ